MKINLQAAQITAQVPNVTIELGDNGSAFISMNLLIGDIYKIDFDETYTGSLTKTFPLQRGSYNCTLLMAAYKHGALGPTYNSYLKIAGSNVATTNGSIPDGSDSDYDSVNFQLIIN